jgi:3-hydroxyacyl-CoA dehydrogenase/enoyl-CoA hydratase/3-hydroxybutyryl-CoA epimerase
MALACSARVAGDSDEVQIGLPEVRLGIIPGWGGTQRLPRLIGLPAALGLILTGRTAGAREAKRLGLVDSVVPLERVRAEARRLIERMGPGRPAAPRRELPLGQRMLLKAPARNVLLWRAAARTRAATGGHYPAPLAAIATIGRGFADGIDEGFHQEAESVAALVTGEVSRNLTRIFLDSRESGSPGGPPAREIRRMVLLGAGVMGGSIAAVAASKGISVRLRDVGREPLERGLRAAHAILAGRGRRRRPAAETQKRMARIEPTIGLEGFATAGLVLEAVVEDLAIKRAALAQVEAVVGEACVLATNTSALSVDAIASALKRPGRLVGLHFFNPADRMPLVEVVRGKRSDPEAVATARSFARRLGKTPVVVADAPGFVVNRLLMPYLAETLRILGEGSGASETDEALTAFGMPMGPFALFDQIGIDVAAKVSKVLAAAFGDRLPPAAPLEALARSGRLGVKSGHGFYRHRGRKPRADARAVEIARSAMEPAGGSRPAPAPHGEALVRRLLYPMINEAARVVEEGVAADPRTIDVAMVFGAGFPPFRGGPLRWADTIGAAAIAADLDEMARIAGPHLAPSEALLRIAASGGRFHRD